MGDQLRDHIERAVLATMRARTGAVEALLAEAVQLQAWDRLDRLHIVDTGVHRPLAVGSYWWPTS